MTLQQMIEIPAPSVGILGGISQSQESAPVKFYRFTDNMKREMKEQLYLDPFNPLATEEDNHDAAKKASKTRRPKLSMPHE